MLSPELSVSIFDKTHILQALMETNLNDDNTNNGNQLELSLLSNPNNTIRASQHGYSSTEAAFYLLDIARRIKCRRVEKINLLASREYRGIFPFGNRLELFKL